MALMIVCSALAALSALSIFAGFVWRSRDTTVSERLDTYLATGDPNHAVTLKELELSKPFSERVIIPMAKSVAGAFVWLLPQNRMNALRQRLTMAGNPANISPRDFVGVKGLVMTLVVGMAVLFGYLSRYQPTFFNLILLGLVGFCSFSLPDFWLSRKIAQRQLAITHSLPDALDLLVISNEAGLSFESGIAEITGKWENELATEFRRVLRDIGMGLPRRDALNNLSDRTGVADVNSFVTAINQAESMGVSIARVLTVQAEELRVRRRQRAQERANQAPVKMMFPLVFLIFPAIFAVLLGPAVPEILQTIGG